MKFLCWLGWHDRRLHPNVVFVMGYPTKVMCIKCGKIREEEFSHVTKLSDGTEIKHMKTGKWK